MSYPFWKHNPQRERLSKLHCCSCCICGPRCQRDLGYPNYSEVDMNAARAWVSKLVKVKRSESVKKSWGARWGDDCTVEGNGGRWWLIRDKFNMHVPLAPSWWMYHPERQYHFGHNFAKFDLVDTPVSKVWTLYHGHNACSKLCSRCKSDSRLFSRCTAEESSRPCCTATHHFLRGAFWR